MRARAVIGANFGDEGKGLVVDWLCRQGAGMVVRFNGGAQAGHTVVDRSGLRHVFHHFGSGSFAGVPTYLSEYFVVNPILFEHELYALNALGIRPVVYAHPKCLVTTFADMVINQHEENKRGSSRHGSVGVGVNETINRSNIPELRITMGDIWNGSNGLRSKLEELCGKYARFRTGEPIKDPGNMIDAFLRGCDTFADQIHPLGIQQCEDPVFEGAQGLLLDQDNKEFFPHLTRSNTGMKNVRALCAQAGISDVDAYYVTRTYLTRHGAGPLPGEDPSMRFHDDTNVEHPFQGRIRFAPLDPGLPARCRADGGTAVILVVTHMDQLERQIPEAKFTAYGPTAAYVQANSRGAR
jgi:adenylosuccinate synthase